MYCRSALHNKISSPYNGSFQAEKGKVSFGQVFPQDLFIKLPEYGRNERWANSMVTVIGDMARKIREGNRRANDFLYLLYDIAKHYNASLKGVYGKTRTFEDRLPVHSFGQWAVIYKRAREILKSPDLCQKYGMVNGEKLLLASFKPGPYYNGVNIYFAPVENIRKILRHIEGIYSELMKPEFKQAYKTKDKAKLAEIHKKVAEIQWYLAHAEPYERGSAGISIVLTKTIYEGLNIQTSGWKKKIAHDLEAFVTPLEQFVKNYPHFFERKPHYIEEEPQKGWRGRLKAFLG